ncbi:MAG: STAS domain-containing protein [Syntrophobacteraceae bacterium]
MLQCTVEEKSGLKWVAVSGRIDSLAAPDVQRLLDGLIRDGQRLLVVDLEDVHYVSSAGLRIFVSTQKQLKKIGGEVVLHRVSENALKILKLGGLTGLFRFVSSPDEAVAALRGEPSPSRIEKKEIDGIPLQVVEKPGRPGKLVAIGSQSPLAGSGYTESDVVAVDPGKVPFGLGMATFGEEYAEYRDLFGEALILDGSFLFYPAVRRPAVDFILHAAKEPGLEYRFLNGLGFDGTYRYTMAFDAPSPLDLGRLVDVLFGLSDADLLGFSFLAESEGLWGMHLKKVPIAENRPERGGIFDPGNFHQWMHFPVEPSDIDHIVVGCGIAARNPEKAPQKVRELLPTGSRFHVHGAVCSKAPPSRRIECFEEEIVRVLSELEIGKIQHLLGQSAFGSGMAGIIELEA